MNEYRAKCERECWQTLAGAKFFVDVYRLRQFLTHPGTNKNMLDTDLNRTK